MKMIALSYGQTLFDLHISYESIQSAEKILKENENLVEALENPTISMKEKEHVIEAIFPAEIQNFFKVLCRNEDIGYWKDIFVCFMELKRYKEKTVKALLLYVDMPKEKQLIQVRHYLKKKYNADQVELELKKDSSLIGGFILKVQDDVIDNSLKGRMKKMQQTLMWR